jgi:hypothetical protein
MTADRDNLAQSLARTLLVEAVGMDPESVAGNFSRFGFVLGTANSNARAPRVPLSAGERHGLPDCQPSD